MSQSLSNTGRICLTEEYIYLLEIECYLQIVHDRVDIEFVKSLYDRYLFEKYGPPIKDELESIFELESNVEFVTTTYEIELPPSSDSSEYLESTSVVELNNNLNIIEVEEVELLEQNFENEDLVRFFFILLLFPLLFI